MGFGCVVECFNNGVKIFVADCDDMHEAEIWNMVIDRSHREEAASSILYVGLRYYTQGYISKGIASRLNGLSKGRKHVSRGGISCVKKDADNLMEMKLHYVSPGGVKYTFEISSNGSHPINISSKWTPASNHTRKREILNVLNSNITYDGQFLNVGCPVLLSRQNRLPRQAQYIYRRRLCSRKYMLDGWKNLWKNWTKYRELLSEKQVDVGFVDDYAPYRAYKASREDQGKELWVYMIFGGCVMLMIMFGTMCCRRRREIIHDLVSMSESSTGVGDTDF